MPSILFYILYVIVIGGTIIHLILSGNQPTKTMAWGLMIVLLPVLGVFFYLLLGVNRRKYKFYKIRAAERVRKYLAQKDQFYRETIAKQALHLGGDDIHQKLFQLISNNSRFLPSSSNKITLLRNGPNTFDAIFQALEKAEKSIHIQYYILEEGELLSRMAEIFKKKAEEGVEIRLLYDGVGSQNLSQKFLNDFQGPTCYHSCFLPIANLRPLSTINYRNHRKIIVIDGKVGFTGGINVSDKYVKDLGALGIWHDMHMRLEGSIVNNLQAIFVTDWNFAIDKEEDGNLLRSKYFPKNPPIGSSLAQIVASGPDSTFSSIRQAYFALITQADDYVYITNSYVIPGSAILTALQTAALSGIDVRILIPALSDSAIVKWSVRSYFEELLLAGVRIYLYQDYFLHSKTIVVDDSILSVGTANFDIRSFEQNFEVNAVIYDEKVARELKSYFLDDLKNSIELDLKAFQQRSWKDKLREGVAKIFSPVL